MSKKQLLEETTVRKFMKLANLEPLSDTFVKENLGYTAEEEMPMGDEPVGMEAGAEEVDMDVPMDDAGGDDLDVEIDDAGEGGEVSPEVAKKVVKAVLDALGVQGTVEDDEEDMGDDDSMDAGGEEMDMEEPEEEAGEGEEESDEEENDEEELEEAKEEVDEEKEVEEAQLSEDELVENVLRRVTARLVAEAKRVKKETKSVKERMKERKYKKKEDMKQLDEDNHVKTHQKNSKVLTKGANNHNVYKGTPDMEMKPLKGKNGKTGKGGHEMKPVKKSHNHIVTHDSKVDKLTSKGPNKA